MWVLSRALDFYTLFMYPYETGLRLHYIEIPLFFDDSCLAWAYPRPNRFSFYFFAAIITVIWELWYAKKQP
jgi:hypothetical protein